MNEKFWNLIKEKQDRMINAALKVFAQNGYRRASTDEIVKEAGISKGLLFHYFASKQGIYLFVCEYSARYTAMEVSRASANGEEDLFEVQKQMELAKARVMKQYPYMQLFLNQAYIEDEKEIAKKSKDYLFYLKNVLKEIYDKADLSLFKPDIDTTMIMHMMQLALEGLLREYCRKENRQPDALYEEAAAYLDTLKNNLYK